MFTVHKASGEMLFIDFEQSNPISLIYSLMWHLCFTLSVMLITPACMTSVCNPGPYFMIIPTVEKVMLIDLPCVDL